MSSTSVESAAARQHAFRTHVEPQIEVLLRVAAALTGSWADSEDLVQDTLIRAYRSIETFDGAHPRAWLMTIMRRAHLNSLRRQRPDLTGDDCPLDGHHGHRPAFSAALPANPALIVTERVFDEDVDRALASLEEKFRTVLLLVDVDQLTYAEASELLGIPMGTVMSRLSRARARVRSKLRGSASTRRIT